jgi:hypothetical protein
MPSSPAYKVGTSVHLHLVDKVEHATNPSNLTNAPVGYVSEQKTVGIHDDISMSGIGGHGHD